MKINKDGTIRKRGFHQHADYGVRYIPTPKQIKEGCAQIQNYLSSQKRKDGRTNLDVRDEESGMGRIPVIPLDEVSTKTLLSNGKEASSDLSY